MILVPIDAVCMGHPRCLPNNLCVHILPSTQYGWQDIENVVKEVKLPWRLPLTRSSYMLETNRMIKVGSINKQRFPLIAHLDEYDAK